MDQALSQTPLGQPDVSLTVGCTEAFQLASIGAVGVVGDEVNLGQRHSDNAFRRLGHYQSIPLAFDLTLQQIAVAQDNDLICLARRRQADHRQRHSDGKGTLEAVCSHHGGAKTRRRPAKRQESIPNRRRRGCTSASAESGRVPKRQSENLGSEREGVPRRAVWFAPAAVVKSRHGTRTRRNSRTSTGRPRKSWRAIVDRQAARGNPGKTTGKMPGEASEETPGQALQGSSPALIGVVRLVRVPLHHHGHGRGNRRRGAWSEDHLPHVIDRGILRPDKSEADVHPGGGRQGEFRDGEVPYYETGRRRTWNGS